MKALARVTAFCGLSLVSGFASVASAAEAIPVYINNNGIAFSRMQDGQVIAYDPVAAFDENTIAVADCNAFKAELKGVSWCFSSLTNQEAFVAATGENGNNRYVPFGGGHCSLGLANGNLVARGDPRTAVRIGNELILNGNFDVRARFLQDTERNLDNARLRFQLAIQNGDLVQN